MQTETKLQKKKARLFKKLAKLHTDLSEDAINNIINMKLNKAPKIKKTSRRADKCLEDSLSEDCIMIYDIVKKEFCVTNYSMIDESYYDCISITLNDNSLFIIPINYKVACMELTANNEMFIVNVDALELLADIGAYYPIIIDTDNEVHVNTIRDIAIIPSKLLLIIPKLTKKIMGFYSLNSERYIFALDEILDSKFFIINKKKLVHLLTE